MEKKQTAVEWLVNTINDKIDYIPIKYWDNIRIIIEQALEMENKINQEYYNEGAQDCKKAFEKIISDVTGNINNI